MAHPPKPQLVIHIGDPKTGTSSIQRSLKRNLLACETRTVTSWHQRNAIPLANALREKADPLDRYRYFQVQNWLDQSEADYAVISSEFFAGRNPKVLRETLSKYVPNQCADTRVIAYVRPHASRYLAEFVQRTKAGFFFGEIGDLPKQLKVRDPLRYSPRFKKWLAVFGKNFTLRPFARSQLKDGDAVADFFHEVLQGEPFQLTSTITENSAISLRALSGLRHIQWHLKKNGVKRHLRALFGGAMSNLYITEDASRMEAPHMDSRTASLIRNRYADDATLVDQQFFDAPILQDSLEQSLRNLHAEPFTLDIEALYRASEHERLTGLSRHISTRLLDARNAWITEYHIRRNELTPDEEQAIILERFRKELSELDELLKTSAEILQS